MNEPTSRLVLARHQGERIVIRHGGRILANICVTQINPGRVRLLFDCPEDVEVNRLEIDMEKHPSITEAR